MYSSLPKNSFSSSSFPSSPSWKTDSSVNQYSSSVIIYSLVRNVTYDLVDDLPSDRFPVFVNVVYFPDARSKLSFGILAIVECFLTF